MYILTRADLSSGLQAAQSVHAAFLLSMRVPDVVDAWLKGSSTIVLLQVGTEETLFEWVSVLTEEGVPHLLVREPDLDDEATAVIVPPHAHLPLQGKVLMLV